jgi:hypothetical protein
MLHAVSPFAALQMQVCARAQASASHRRTTGSLPEVCLHRSLGLPVLRRSAHRLVPSNERCARVCSTDGALSRHGFNAKDKHAQFCSVAQRSWFPLALRSTAAPGTAASLGTGFARAASARMLRHQTQGVALVALVALDGLFRRQPRPNPSIEGTSSGKLRLPPAAPHVKR